MPLSYRDRKIVISKVGTSVIELLVYGELDWKAWALPLERASTPSLVATRHSVAFINDGTSAVTTAPNSNANSASGSPVIGGTGGAKQIKGKDGGRRGGGRGTSVSLQYDGNENVNMSMNAERRAKRRRRQAQDDEAVDHFTLERLSS